ncbi:MAG TPA: iron ABC transporter permease, partial [Methylomirabilota bacterium]|nr:iron ABC transporter permease [Methylomirabilota bacterium]
MPAPSAVAVAPRRPAAAGGTGVVWLLAAGLIAALVAAPLAGVLVSLLAPRAEVWGHLLRTQLAELMVNTVLLLLGVGAGTLALGTSLAWLVVAFRFPGRALFESALVLPLAVPAYVIGFAFLGVFDYAGPVQTALRAWLGPGAWLPEPRSYGGVALVMTLVFYPYVYLLARTAFREQGAATLETARSLGMTRGRAFVTLALPMARPALVAGVSLAMMEALADFGTVATLGYRTLTEAVYRVWHGMFDRVAASQLAGLLMLFAFLLLALERALRGRARFVQSQRRGPGIVPVPLAGWRAWTATLACGAVLGLAFVVPVGRLVLWAAETAATSGALVGFPSLLGNTVWLAGLAAATTTALALALAYATRLRPTPGVRLAAQFAGMGYALPGAVIAVGVLVPVALVDHALAALAEAALGRPAAMVLTGSAVALLFAYVVRFLAVGLQTVDAGLGRIAPNLDNAARSLGAGTAGVVRRVHLPLVRGSLLTAAVLVFVETMKEMPATLLLRPFGLETLAVAVWERTAESMWAEAALPALAIVAAGLLPVWLALRLSERGARR